MQNQPYVVDFVLRKSNSYHKNTKSFNSALQQKQKKKGRLIKAKYNSIATSVYFFSLLIEMPTPMLGIHITV